MGVKRWMRTYGNRILRRYGAEIVPTAILFEWQRAHIDKSNWNVSPLPADVARYLQPDNPRLIELQQRYRAFDPDVTTPLVWIDGYVSAEDIAHFRGNNAWIWQVPNIHAYGITLYYLKSIDRLRLLEKLVEDDSFGTFTFPIAGHCVSRDLLDSIAEIYFLDRHLGIGSRTGLRVLDIGAGYGRLAHRMVGALPGIESYFCTDAIPVSTFVSDFYLRYRGVERARAIPLDEIDQTLSDHPVDLAINIHSFSECRTQAIEWWAKLLSKHRVKNLMVVPNHCRTQGELLHTNDGHDFLPLLERYGYRTVLKEPKFLDPVVQEYGLQPNWNHLLELRA